MSSAPDLDPPVSAWDEAPPSSPARPFNLAVAVASLVGAVFSAVSTFDFMQFLDRQVHSIHCSFVPGAGLELGDSGCRTVMMSPYSSFFRESVWGGVPVALWALAVFAFLAYRAGSSAWRATASRQEAAFLVAATGLPLGMSLIYLALSVHLGTTCKVCVGMYASSVGAFVLAVLALRRTPSGGDAPGLRFAGWFLQGVVFVGLLTLVFLASHPTAESKKAGGCGALVQAEDSAHVMIELKSGKVDAVEVLDPLCPSCRALDTRLGASSVGKELGLKGLLFPLDSSCNWMVTESLHPGACVVSEAVLCAAGFSEPRDHAAARRVLAWAFAHQDELREEARKDPPSVRTRLEARFPEVKGCLGGAKVKNKLLKSLRWTVANALPVLTPQLFVREERMCDENTDLGLEYSLRGMLAQKRGGPR